MSRAGLALVTIMLAYVALMWISADRALNSYRPAQAVQVSR